MSAKKCEDDQCMKYLQGLMDAWDKVSLYKDRDKAFEAIRFMVENERERLGFNPISFNGKPECKHAWKPIGVTENSLEPNRYVVLFCEGCGNYKMEVLGCLID